MYYDDVYKSISKGGEQVVNVDLLRAEIEDVGITDVKLAEKMGFTVNTLKNKLEKPHTITADDAYNFVQALRISDTAKILQIFLA